jgi:hypothetical protein
MTTRTLAFAAAMLGPPYCAHCCPKNLDPQPITEVISGDVDPARFQSLVTIGANGRTWLIIDRVIRDVLKDSGFTAIRVKRSLEADSTAVRVICNGKPSPGITGVLFISHERFVLWDCSKRIVAYQVTGQVEPVSINRMTYSLVDYLKRRTPAPSTIR